MKERSFVDFLCGAVACLSVLGVYSIVRDAEAAAQARRKRNLAALCASTTDARFALGDGRRRRRRSIEDDCRHCSGTGACAECAPDPCRVCCGRGIQPPDESLIPRLNRMWGAA